MKLRNLILLAQVSLGFFYSTSVFAEDSLYLCGIVNDIDKEKAEINVNVLSEPCSGRHKFTLDADVMMYPFEPGRKECFVIDSNICRSGYTYSIISVDKRIDELVGPAVPGNNRETKIKK
jgi:hypothetical protein